MQRRTLSLGVLSALLTPGIDAYAQKPGWPDKPVKILLGTPPGGANDLIARALLAPMQEDLGQTVLVDNRTGGGGVISTGLVAKAPPDGCTIGQVTTAHCANPALVARLPYDTIEDFSFVAFLGRTPMIVVVHPSVKANTMQELIDLAKSAPGTIHHGSAGSGTAQHFAGAMLSVRTGGDFVHVPYRGGGPAIVDLVGGQIEMMFGNFASILPHVKAGRVRPIAVTGSVRSPSLPQLPTVAEAANLPGWDSYEYFVMLGPRGIQKDVVDRLNQSIYSALKRPAIATKLQDLGIEPNFLSPEQLTSFMKSEVAKLGEVARQTNMKAD